MNEAEMDEEIQRLEDKQRLDIKREKLKKLKEKVDPGLLSKLTKVVGKGVKKI